MGNSVFVLENFPALGTLFWVEIFHEGEVKYSPVILSDVAKRLQYEITQFESKYSRFNSNSVLSLLNRERTVLYDEDLFQMIQVGSIAGKISNGVFDVFIKEKLEEKGYGLPEEKHAEISTAESSVLSKDGNLTLLGNKGLDLGGVGKGYLIDHLVKILLHEYNIPYFLINGGGDIYATSDNGDPVDILLEHPTELGSFIGKVAIKNQSFCCSSSFKRTWNHEGKEVNHFVAKEEVWAASYVVGETAVLADVFATIACLVSKEKDSLDTFSRSFSSEYMVITDEGGIFTSDNFRMRPIESFS